MVLNLFYDSVDFRYPPLFFFLQFTGRLTAMLEFSSIVLTGAFYCEADYEDVLLSCEWTFTQVWIVTGAQGSVHTHLTLQSLSHRIWFFFFFFKFLIWKVCSADKELWPLSYLRYFLLLKHIHFHYCWALILCYNIASIYYSQLSLALYFVGSSLIVSRARPVQTDCRLTNLRESYGCSITDLTMDIFQTGSLCL